MGDCARGTKVPVSLVYRKGLKKDGTAPLLQYAYGSYGISTDPAFSNTVISLLDRGFVYAIAHIRGGQEMGRNWYENGKLLHKRTPSRTSSIPPDISFAEIRGAGLDLRDGRQRWRTADGRRQQSSASGLSWHHRLVPFVDIVTTMLDDSIPLTTNEFDEWGNPKEKPYYDYMLSYSPYDNVTAQAYPALFVGTGLWDSQVQYYEPTKWVAKLRKLKTDHNPLVFRINMEAGHGGKSGRFQKYREVAEQFAFILDLAKKG